MKTSFQNIHVDGFTRKGVIREKVEGVIQFCSNLEKGNLDVQFYFWGVIDHS